MKKYDKVIGKQFGIIKGERNFVFIKTGGGENKYGKYGERFIAVIKEYVK